METRLLQNQLRSLIEFEQTESPVVSYFFDRDDPDAARILREQMNATRDTSTDIVDVRLIL